MLDRHMLIQAVIGMLIGSDRKPAPPAELEPIEPPLPQRKEPMQFVIPDESRFARAPRVELRKPAPPQKQEQGSRERDRRLRQQQRLAERAAKKP